MLTGVRTYQSAFVPEPRHHVLLSWPLQRDNSAQRQIRERAFGLGQGRGRAAAARSQTAGIKLERQVFPKLYTHRIQSASSYVANLGKAASPLSHTQTHTHTLRTSSVCTCVCFLKCVWILMTVNEWKRGCVQELCSCSGETHSHFIYIFVLCSFSLSGGKDVQNYKIPHDAATGQLRNGHGSFFQGKCFSVLHKNTRNVFVICPSLVDSQCHFL